MRLSESFVKTLKDAPKDAETVNHQLLVRAGYVRQLMAGFTRICRLVFES